MITIQLPQNEIYDDAINEFKYTKGAIARFEYSLRAISNWESKWKKPFLNSELTEEESLDFYKLMALDPVDDSFFTPEVTVKLSQYMVDPMTATRFSKGPEGSGPGGPPSGKVITSEEYYASMFSAGIPLEFENRNFNTLLTIMKVISLANEPPKKMSSQDVLRQNASLNAQRKAQMNTKG